MRKYIIILFLATAFLFNSCSYFQNFEEGADISLRSIGRRIEGKWRIKGVWVNGIDSTTYPPYSQYTQKDSLVLEFIYKEQYGSEKLNFLKGSLGQAKGYQKGGKWSLYNHNKNIVIDNQSIGFDQVLFGVNSNSEWTIICCRNNRLVFDLDSYFPGNSVIESFKNMRILLIPA